MKKILSLIIFVSIFSCTYDKVETVPNTGYPAEISDILVSKCATEGCHNSASRVTSAGLDFSTWDLMFEGGRNGTSVIPYSIDYSFMLYTVNTDTLKGPVLLPTMPYLQPALSTEEYQTLVNWIANGAPDKNGFVKFSDDASRKKVYICMQGCDKVAVVDANTKIIMRYINVGAVANSIEAPHMVRVSPDGNYWYVVFYGGTVLQKFRTSDDSLVATLDFNSADQWNSIIITPDGHRGFVNGTGNNKTKVVDLDAMTLITTLAPIAPHGGFVTPDGHFLYLTSQFGNYINRYDITDPFWGDTQIVLVPGQTLTSVSSPTSQDPHEMMLSPDGSKYFVSCQRSNEVRVFQTSNDSLIKIIPVGVKPQEFDVSINRPYIFVTCTEDPLSANQKGSMYVINYNDLSIAPIVIYTGYQPHGLAVDDEEGLVYVANLNYDPSGSAPHHVSACGGRNGNMTIIDMNTMQLYYKTYSDGSSFQYKNELLAFPYFVSIRK